MDTSQFPPASPPSHPSWVIELAESVAGLMHAHDVLAPVGCHYFQSEELCEVLVFASRTEVFGGRSDGKLLPSRFTLDLRQLLELFSRIEAIEWQALPQDDEDEVGANVAIVGEYRERRICLRIPSKAPLCFEPGRIAHVLEGRFINIW